MIAHLVLSESVPAEPPTEFRILPFGTLDTTKGQFQFTRDDAMKLLAHREDRGVDLQIDYEHASIQEPGKIAEGAPAAGWFQIQLRADGLYAVNVKWTPKARERIRQKEYRYFSPVFAYDKKGHITKLINLALTNDPAIKDLPALVPLRADQVKGISRKSTAPQDPAMMKQILEQQHEEMKAHVEKHLKALSNKLCAKADEHQEMLKDIHAKLKNGATLTDYAHADLPADVIALTGQDGAEALGTVLVWQQEAAKVAGLEARIAELEQKDRDDALQAALSDAVKANKITPAELPEYRELGRKAPDALRLVLKALRPSGLHRRLREPNAGELPTNFDSLTGDARTAALKAAFEQLPEAEKKIVRENHTDPVKYMEARARHLAPDGTLKAGS